MTQGLIALGLLVAFIAILVGAAIWLMRKGEASGKREVQTDLVTQQNERLQQGAKIDAKSVSTDQATDIARKLSRRDTPGG
ncbi:hypothetical protein [Hypericibacter sp.]|uniref:hypothetical protein n=1 Tax=Hypericibacter sp. TaxID=2705401 RepID=UPI003D6CEAE5